MTAATLLTLEEDTNQEEDRLLTSTTKEFQTIQEISVAIQEEEAKTAAIQTLREHTILQEAPRQELMILREVIHLELMILQEVLLQELTRHQEALPLELMILQEAMNLHVHLEAEAMAEAEEAEDAEGNYITKTYTNMHLKYLYGFFNEKQS